MASEPAYRVTVFNDPRGPWRSTWHKAFRDAIRLGLTAYDEERREHYLAVPVDIEQQATPAD